MTTFGPAGGAALPGAGRDAGCGIEDGGARGRAPAALTCSPTRVWRGRSESAHGTLNGMGLMEEVITGPKSYYVTFGVEFKGVLGKLLSMSLTPPFPSCGVSGCAGCYGDARLQLAPAHQRAVPPASPVIPTPAFLRKKVPLGV